MPLINDIIVPKSNKQSTFQKFLSILSKNRVAKMLYKNLKRSWKPILLILFGIIIALSVIIISNRRVASKFPQSVSDKVGFVIMYPAQDSKNIQPAYNSIKYSNENKAVTYDVYVAGKKVVLTQQQTPEIFRENGVYTYKLSQSKQYATLDSRYGNVALTRPSELQGQTLAWLNAKDTLVLGRDFNELSLEEWQMLFNSFVLINDR